MEMLLLFVGLIMLAFCVHTRWVLLVFGIHALQGLLALTVKDSFEALSILVSFEESLDPAHMGVHKIAMLSVHACLLGLWSLPLDSFFSPFLWVLSCNKVWQGFIILVHVFLVKELFITIFGMNIVTRIA
jgi:hypothetical protein